MFKKILLTLIATTLLFIGLALATYIGIFGTEKDKRRIPDGKVILENGELCFGGYKKLNNSENFLLNRLSIGNDIDHMDNMLDFNPNKSISANCFKLSEINNASSVEFQPNKYYFIFYSIRSKEKQETYSFDISFCLTEKKDIVLLQKSADAYSATCKK